MSRFSRVVLACVYGLLSLLSVASAADSFQPVIDSPIRSTKDREQDQSRKPTEFLAFSQVKPGMIVLDVASGGGYTAQLLALAVGPQGKLFAQVAKPSPALEARLSVQPQGNFQVLMRAFDDLYPSDAPRLDLISLVLSYHDIAYMPVDRNKMNQSMFNALKPGGHLILIDHSAKPGSGLDSVQTIHRIDEQIVIKEMTAVGFKLEAESNSWRNKADPREQHFSKMDIPDDRFALRFVKP